ncbi:MAG TPA: arginine--tRNA ligase, partial [Candidatus Acidoferrales bacterium]|nr:arginine--tRNA ligase [Candidatus Acidoferrales bacterium]
RVRLGPVTLAHHVRHISLRERSDARTAAHRSAPQRTAKKNMSDPATPSIDVARPIRALVREAVERAWARAVQSGALPPLPGEVEVRSPEPRASPPMPGELDAPGATPHPDRPWVPEVEVTRPDNPEHGDFSSNLALKLARPLRRSPLAIAQALADELARDPGPVVGSVEVAPPGFLNMRLAPAAVESAVDAARAGGPAFGRIAAVHPQNVNVEFVSANPTGPLHIGNARGAFVGDLLCRVLEAAGQRVTREYYFNDFGSQVRLLGASVRALRDDRDVPEDGYRGAYVHDLARELPDEIRARALEAATAAAARAGAGAGAFAGAVEAADADAVVGQWASERVRRGIEASLAHLGVRFDVWTTEGSLYRDRWVDRAVERLREGGWLYEQDDALWFRSTAFGDDKDRVVRRSTGQFTYFGSDIGYLLQKFDRGFDHLVYIWGADHHGTVARVRNAAQAMGFDRDAVEMLLVAWVRFVRDGREVSMSKRAGEFITLDELLDEIGVDAARWFIAARGHTSGIDFDIELARRQSSENPVYYVQYAHARISSILRKAEEAGLAPAVTLASALGDDAIALDLGKLLLRLPEVVEDAAAAHETHGVTAYATELATAFHAFYRDRRVIDRADPVTSGTRLALVTATRLALANTLALLGVSAPDSM